jgi:hypothetical protein
VAPYSGQLSARGETLRVRNSGSNVVHTFTYEGAPTPAQRFLRVAEIMYHPAPASVAGFSPDSFEYIELKNTSTNTTLDLSGVRFTSGISYAFGNVSLAPGASIAVARDMAAFKSRYGTRAVAGEYSGALDNSGERIILVDGTGEEILDFPYENDWYPETDGGGAALIIANETAEPDAWSDKINWQPSGSMRLSLAAYGTGGATLEFRAAANRTYTVEYTDALASQAWQVLGNPVTNGTGSLIRITDAAPSGRRYYRLVAQESP